MSDYHSHSHSSSLSPCLSLAYRKLEVATAAAVERGRKEEGKEPDYRESAAIRVHKLGFLILLGMYIEDIVPGGACACAWDCG